MTINFILNALDDTRRIVSAKADSAPRIGEKVTFDRSTYKVDEVEYRYEPQKEFEPYAISVHSGIYLNCHQTQDSEISVKRFANP